MTDLVESVVASLPDPTLVEDVSLFDKPSPETELVQIRFGDNFICGSQHQGRRIFIFQAKSEQDVRNAIKHEWAHMVHREYPFLARMFDLAATVEADGFFAATYAGSTDENFAVHLAECICAEDEDVFWMFAYRAPVRAYVLARVLEELISRVEPTNRSTRQATYSNRVKFINENIELLALEILVSEVLMARSEDRVAAAAKLLLQYGDESHLQRLEQLTRVDVSFEPFGDRQLTKIQFLPALEEVYMAGTEFGEKTLRAIAKMPNLQVLSLAASAVNNRMMQYIPDSVTLLDIHSTEIDDGAIFQLKRLKYLQRLIVDRSTFTADGITELETALPGCQISEVVRNS